MRWQVAEVIRTERRRGTAWPGIAAIVLVAIAAVLRVPEDGWNAEAHFALVQALADGTPRIDDHLNQSGDIAYVDGHYYAAKAPGLAMFSLPAYALAKALGAIPLGSPTSPPPGAHTVDGSTMWYGNLVVVVAFLCLLLLIRWAVGRSIGTAGTPVALMLGLGTLLLPYATTYFAHVLAAALGFSAFALAVYTRPARPLRALVGAGVLAGLAIVVELPAVIVAVAVALYLALDRPHLRRLASFAGGALIGIIPLLLFNTWAFGSPLRMSYAHAVKALGASGHDVLGANDAGFYGITHPSIGALLDLLVSDRGLFVLAPITALALVGLPGLARRGLRSEAFFIAGLTAAMLLYNASYYLPFGGFSAGPRFLVLLLPFLAFPLADAWLRWRTVTLIVAAVSAFWMISATLAGPNLPEVDSPNLWLTRIADGNHLTDSILIGGRTGAAVSLVPALAAILLAAGVVDFAVQSARTWRLREGRDPESRQVD
jgi:hypothetical protein